MPNWAEGVIKIRGKREDIKRFLFEGLESIPSLTSTITAMVKNKIPEKPNITIEEDDYDLTMSSESGFYIKGTRRAFIKEDIVWYFNDDKDKEEVLSIESFKQAWSVDTETFAEISKRYNIDFRIYVFEKGMQFNQDIEIHKGQIIKDNVIKFDNYDWDCLFSSLGG